MLKGQTYSPSNSELVYDRTKCRAMLSHFNSGENASASAEKRRQLARGILASVGVGVEIESPFRCEYGYNIRIRSGTFIGPECIIEDPCIISIGSNCVIGPRVTISGKKSSSNMNDRNGSRSLFFGSEVWIGDQVCIKTGVVIHAGVRIGRGSTILAGAVVTEVSVCSKPCLSLETKLSVYRGKWKGRWQSRNYLYLLAPVQTGEDLILDGVS